jgi:hypothetical protein
MLAAERSCAFGDALGCDYYANILVLSGDLAKAQHVLNEKACEGDKACMADRAICASSGCQAIVSTYVPTTSPQPSRGLAFLNGMNAALGVVTDQLAAQNAQQDARNAELNRQAAALTASNEQRRAAEAEQQRRAAAARAQSEAAAQARSRVMTAPSTPVFVASTGTAPPANCVYLSPSQPCVPLAQYAQMQAQQQSSSQGICPASGFVPGVMLRQASDVAIGVPCKPGTPYGPLIATTASGGYTGVTPPDPASAGASGSGSGSSGTGGPFDPDLNNCVVYFYKNDPITGDHLILQNNCSVRARVWFYASSQAYGAESLDPGEAGNTYAGHDKIVAAGGVSIYACPEGDMPRQADGTLAENGVNNRYRCSRK